MHMMYVFSIDTIRVETEQIGIGDMLVCKKLSHVYHLGTSKKPVKSQPQ